ncbi:B-cell differentiation antigen CD72 isoform X4 [Pelodiscus sinensis]|uniref:B-cell differentiation antigen CD72 isoform X4 n=2 Tax=Pelodiscus sinensis TaxID=13735 RepID=UPI003F6BBADD
MSLKGKLAAGESPSALGWPHLLPAQCKLLLPAVSGITCPLPPHEPDSSSAAPTPAPPGQHQPLHLQHLPGTASPSIASTSWAPPAPPSPAPPGNRQPLHRQLLPGTANTSTASTSWAPPAPPSPTPPGHCQPLHRQHLLGTASFSTASTSQAPPASPLPAPPGHRQPLHRQHLLGTASFSIASPSRAPPASPTPAPPGHCQHLHCQPLPGTTSFSTASPSWAPPASPLSAPPGHHQPLPHQSPAGSQMAHNVTYADLRFVRAPAGSSPSSRAPEAAPDAEEDAELTYENIHLGQTVEVKRGPGAEQSHEPWWGTYHLPLGLLGACLFLLASTIGLGVRYWQVSQHLQQASQAHEAESSRLSQQVSSKGASLAQTARELELAQRELEEARRDLEQERLEGNRTQERLQQLEAKLDGTTKTLATLTQEKQEVTEKLSRVKQELSSIRPCEQTGCCPEQWVLYRGKCLFISRWPMNWDESRKDCEGKSARLLVTRPWNWSTMPSFLVNTDVQYWIGLKRDWRTSLWIDDPLFEDHKESYKSCGAVQGGSLLSGTCEHSKPWICEKAPEQPSSARWPHFLQ